MPVHYIKEASSRDIAIYVVVLVLTIFNEGGEGLFDI